MDSLDAFVAGTRSEEGRRANQELAEDEAQFIDVARSSFFVAEEHVLLGD